MTVAFSLTYRITLTLQIAKHEIPLIDIGSRDKVYG